MTRPFAFALEPELERRRSVRDAALARLLEAQSAAEIAAGRLKAAEDEKFFAKKRLALAREKRASGSPLGDARILMDQADRERSLARAAVAADEASAARGREMRAARHAVTVLEEEVRRCDADLRVVERLRSRREAAHKKDADDREEKERDDAGALSFSHRREES